jgi:hypothetical protein
MRRALKFVFLLVIACTIEAQIERVRPGAKYTITKGDYDGIVWTDEEKSKPTRGELSQALADCQAASIDTEKETKKTIIKNKSSKTEDRLEALIKYLDLD